ncbi:MAG: acyl--CoA ligase [Burkholderiales bacterium]|nr:acyl--CoA ligase [Burkholderiales bacterium]
MLIHDARTRQERRERGWWGETRLHDLLARHAREAPGRESLVDPPNLAEVTGEAPQRLTWAQVHSLVERLACALLDAGLNKDDVVLVQMANNHALPALYLACARLGIIVSPTVAQYREHELEPMLQRTRARAIVVSARIGAHDHAAMASALAARQARPPAVLAFAPAEAVLPPGVTDLWRALPIAADRARLAAYEATHPVSADETVSILWTSGSEGRAKGVARTHNDWMLYGPQIGGAYEVGAHTRLLNGRPLVTHGAFVGSLTPWLYHGATLVNHHPFTLPLFLRQLHDERISFTALAPALVATLLARPELLRDVDLRHLKYVGSGSAPLNSALLQAFEERFGVRVINFFGSTEGASLVATPQDVPDARLRAHCFPRFGSGGFAWSHPASALVETRLVDLSTGEDILSPGRAGELRYRGPMVMTGYLNEPELSAAAFDERGFYRSGDLFEIAGAQGEHYRFTGRAKDIIIRGGMNISAAEVEGLVAEHPAVAEVAVVPLPDPRLGERVCACVVLRAGQTLSLANLVAWLRDQRQVGIVKLPEHLVCLDGLPRNPNNKVIKAELRAIAARATGQ